MPENTITPAQFAHNINIVLGATLGTQIFSLIEIIFDILIVISLAISQKFHLLLFPIFFISLLILAKIHQNPEILGEIYRNKLEFCNSREIKT